MQTQRTFLRVSFTTVEEHDELVGRLDVPAFLGAEHADDRLILWLDPTKLDGSDVGLLLSNCIGAPMTELEIEHVPTTDWLKQWRDSLVPVTIAGVVTIMPSATEAAQAHTDIVIALEPKMAFGTGHHATTQLCIELLLDTVETGQQWIDLGTGSGLLAIVAAKLGAAQVIALDCDPDAIAEARENISANNCDDTIEVRQADVSVEEIPSSDGIVANLHSELLLQLGQRIAAALRPGGAAIVSGILSSQSNEVVVELTRWGLSLLAKRERGEWVALRFSKR
ncbi:MAG: hypothetical protein KatS3mg038_2851 [Candidatus Kapaibacterium sp.]|nr:MAG: hypothetical protein KatS3mg038_2851 [Candidatus Kapabacteria bacterium]